MYVSPARSLTCYEHLYDFARQKYSCRCKIITGLGLHFQAAADTIIYLWQHVPETQSTVKFQGIYLCVILFKLTWFPQIMTYLVQGLFKDFWGTFSRTFQGLFFVLSNFNSQKQRSTIMDFLNKTYRDHLIFSSPEKWWGERFGYVFLSFLDDLLYYGCNTGSKNLLERGVWGSSPRKFLSELVQNPAILDNSGGYTSLILCHNKSRDCPFWNRLIHWNT